MTKKELVVWGMSPVWMPPALLIAGEWRVGPKARLLDRMKPGWHNDINLTTLNLASDTDCVLGQLYGHFYKAPWRLNWRSRTGVVTFAWCYRERGWASAVKARRAADIAQWAAEAAEASHGDPRQAMLGDLIARAERPKGQEAREEEVEWVR